MLFIILLKPKIFLGKLFISWNFCPSENVIHKGRLSYNLNMLLSERTGQK
jgi:hypothetical protein